MHVSTQKMVAIKVIDKSWMDEVEIKFIQAEVDSLVKLKHENVVTLIDVFERQESAYIYIVLEYMEMTLASFINSS